MKRILIVGAGSYVGESVREYLSRYPDRYEVDVLEARGLKPDKEQMDGFDVVFHVAGIAHIRETRKNARLYYEVNRDLATGVAECAKSAGVRQFILMSTMAVYGMAEGVVKKDTKPKPTSHYGKSKLEADRAIWKLRDEEFRVAVLRPPMIYGSGCKGNYQKLRWLALHTPVFPNTGNERSMLFTGNLCVFVGNIIDRGRSGLFFPQNGEYVDTGRMVREIAASHGRKVRLIQGFGWISKVPVGAVKKVSGSLVYEHTGDEITEYGFREGIRKSENE